MLSLLLLRVGYRHIDCARRYCNEIEVGCALKKLFNDGVVKREELWITSKLWCNEQALEDVSGVLDRTLHELQLDYVDLYLIHWPVSIKKDLLAMNPKTLPNLAFWLLGEKWRHFMNLARLVLLESATSHQRSLEIF